MHTCFLDEKVDFSAVLTAKTLAGGLFQHFSGLEVRRQNAGL